MHTIRSISVALLLVAVPAGAAAQRLESRLAATGVGAVAGVAGGGYISLSIIVAESRVGRYVHDFRDVLGWRSVPVIAGGAIGAGVGAISPRRLEAAILYGAIGLGAGALAGIGVGSVFWEPPEGRWAGAAIGAGVGLMVGNMLGILYPYRAADGGDDNTGSAGIPLMVRVSF